MTNTIHLDNRHACTDETPTIGSLKYLNLGCRRAGQGVDERHDADWAGVGFLFGTVVAMAIGMTDQTSNWDLLHSVQSGRADRSIDCAHLTHQKADRLVEMSLCLDATCSETR